MAANQQNQDEVVVPSYLKVSKIAAWLFYFWVVAGIAFLIMRVFLLATSANMTAGFSNFVLQVSDDYLEPFRGIFPPSNFGETGYLDVSALFAIIVYLFLAWGFKALVEYVEGKIEVSKAEQKEKIRKLEAQRMMQQQRNTTKQVRKPATQQRKTN